MIKLLVFLLVLLAGAIGYIFVNDTSGKSEPQKSKLEISSSHVIEKVKPIGELNLLEISSKEIVDTGVSKFLNLYKAKMLFVASYKVKFYVDLRELNSSDFVVSDKRVEILLPHPKYEVIFDMESSYIYDESAFGLSIDEKNRLMQDIPKRVDGFVKNQNLIYRYLPTLQIQAKGVLEGILKQVDANISVDVRFKEPPYEQGVFDPMIGTE